MCCCLFLYPGAQYLDDDAQTSDRRSLRYSVVFGAALLFIILSYFIGAIPDFFPVTGLAEAYMTWWHAHNILGLWITPVSAAIAYYIIPKVCGNTLYSHKIGHLHFWSIAAFYSTPGAHHLMGAPIPEWLKSFASVSGVLIMIPALAFVVNMLMTMKDKWWMFTKSIPLQWALTGVLFAIPLNIQGAFQQTRALNWYIHGTHWIVAHAHLALLGFSSFIEIGAIYYGLPKLLKREIYSANLARIHFWMMAIGFWGFGQCSPQRAWCRALPKCMKFPTYNPLSLPILIWLAVSSLGQ